MTVRLVSFLGLGNEEKPNRYDSTRYKLDGKPSPETPLMERALFELLAVDSIIVLGTKEVRQAWFDSGLFHRLMEEGSEQKAPRAHFELLGKGESETELWQIFHKLVFALTPEALEEAGEREAPDAIVLDTTHGFRIQPMFGMSAVAFMLSEWARDRERVPDPPAIRVLYGGYEARDKKTNITKIWDLTGFLTATRWNAAIDALMRYGRADDFEQLAMIERKRSVAAARADGKKGEALGEAGLAGRIGEAARRFADDLATVRLRDIIADPPARREAGSAVKLHAALSHPAAEEIGNRLPLLRNALNTLREWVEPLRAVHTTSWEGLGATAHLARLLGRLERFASQAAMLREGLVTHYHLARGGEPMPEPGPGFEEDLRKRMEEQWGAAGEAYKDGSREFPRKVLENLRLSQPVVNARNDMLHGGLNGNPSKAKSLIAGLGKRAREFARLVGADDRDQGG